MKPQQVCISSTDRSIVSPAAFLDVFQFHLEGRMGRYLQGDISPAKIAPFMITIIGIPVNLARNATQHQSRIEALSLERRRRHHQQKKEKRCSGENQFHIAIHFDGINLNFDSVYLLRSVVKMTSCSSEFR